MIPHRKVCLAAAAVLVAFTLPAAALEPVAEIYAVRTPANTPMVVPYSVIVTPGDGINTVTIPVLTNPLPAHGTLTVPSPITGTPGQGITYTPNAGYTGLDQFYFRVQDVDGDISIGLISINVGNVPAVAGNDQFVVGQDPNTFVDILFNDLGFADPVTFQILQQPANGTLNLIIPNPLWQAYIGVFYTPGQNFVGQDSFQYQLSDSIDTSTATVTLQVSADTDSDGLLDPFDNCPAQSNPDQADTDSDGRGNACDNCPVRSNSDQANTDSDGRGNACDNCTQLANDQRDTDGDGFGNRCDADLNNDNNVNFSDLNLFRQSFGAQGSSTLNADFNSSNSVNAADLNILRALFGKPPGPAAPP
ncbi:MAG: hypothetical protein FJ197_10205 [Gammaproteobacteria bacterium]|nr:hypothetical protein [Gammaproteobacteria bacterium]